jgi:ADP-heptose:LPS heptosyltransferase
MKIAVTHPGKLGDALYSLPTIRHISKILGSKVDFWTSEQCRPLIDLFKAQSCINDVFIAKNYVAQHHGCGTQPWELIPEKEYVRIYYLGLRNYPQGRLVDYYPAVHGFTFCDTTISYDMPMSQISPPCVVVCPGRNPLLKGLFSQIMKALAKENNVFQIGPESELINLEIPSLINCPNLDMLETVQTLNCAKLFIGTLSANLVLANGFPCKKIIICEKERHYPAHDIKSDNHFYLDFPTSLEKVMECAK